MGRFMTYDPQTALFALLDIIIVKFIVIIMLKRNVSTCDINEGFILLFYNITSYSEMKMIKVETTEIRDRRIHPSE